MTPPWSGILKSIKFGSRNREDCYSGLGSNGGSTIGKHMDIPCVVSTPLVNDQPRIDPKGAVRQIDGPNRPLHSGIESGLNCFARILVAIPVGTKFQNIVVYY